MSSSPNSASYQSFRNLPPLAGLATFEAAQAPGLSVEACVNRLKRLHWSFRRLHQIFVHRLVSEPVYELKMAFSLHAHYCAEHAAALRARVAEMREPPLGLDHVPDAALDLFFDEVLSATDTAALLAGIYRHALPALLLALRNRPGLDDPLPMQHFRPHRQSGGERHSSELPQGLSAFREYAGRKLREIDRSHDDIGVLYSLAARDRPRREHGFALHPDHAGQRHRPGVWPRAPDADAGAAPKPRAGWCVRFQFGAGWQLKPLVRRLDLHRHLPRELAGLLRHEAMHATPHRFQILRLGCCCGAGHRDQYREQHCSRGVDWAIEYVK